MLLLVLDNFEQLLDAAPLVARLFAACPNLRVIATSRAPLRLAGEREFPVESLALPDAVELFEGRASLLGRDVLGQALTRATVEAICERLDRLPLALELAAARLRSLTPDQLLARLEQRLTLLTSGPRDAPDRQRTLRATLDWSYQLLAPAEQRVLAGLGVFVGGFTLEAAEQVCGAHLDTLDTLVEQSLLRHANDRYTMLETVREYALDKLRSTGELEEARMRHADWALALLERADPRDDKAFLPALIRTLAWTELDNLRQAIPLLIERRPDEIASRVLVVAWVWDYARQWREGIDLVKAIRAAGKEPSEAVLARAGAGLAHHFLQVGDLDSSQASADDAIRAAERTSDNWPLVIALHARAFVAAFRGEPNPEQWAERALSIARAGEEPIMTSYCLSKLAGVICDLQPDQARRYCEEAAELARANGDFLPEELAIEGLALIALQEQRYEDAESIFMDLLRRGLDDSMMRDSLTRAYVVHGLGFALAGRRAHHEAACLIAAGDEIIQRLGLFQHQEEQEERTAALERIEAAIGTGEMEEALREGRRLQIGEACSLALSLFAPIPEPEA